MAAELNGNRLQSWTETDWNLLLERINAENCTPIIGPGVYSEVLPLSLKMAQAWTQEFPGYPFGEHFGMGRVAQFLATVSEDNLMPKDRVAKQFKNLKPPDFTNPDEPHRVLASLPLPVYITTNYDDYMVQALSARKEKDKNPVQEYCRWNKFLQRGKPSVFEDYTPTIANPVVYHLHGHSGKADSLVLTDDDYLDFLVNVSADNTVIPERIGESLAGTSLLLLGFQLDDWNFRVLFRSIVSFLQNGMQKKHLSVQLAPGGEKATPEQIQRAEVYFERYFGIRDVKVYWKTSQEFIIELRKRWEDSENANS